ncbi:hypothetical protein HOY80DRAFT_1062781 [Tuber brumale]|nr:hypothetical protein HOY80DRAFT_1062781 [Tuber brumale]
MPVLYPPAQHTTQKPSPLRLQQFIWNIRLCDGNAHCGNITGSFNKNKTVYKSDEDAQIMGWLSPLEPDNRHQGVRDERLDGMGDWLLETNEFRE